MTRTHVYIALEGCEIRIKKRKEAVKRLCTKTPIPDKVGNRAPFPRFAKGCK